MVAAPRRWVAATAIALSFVLVSPAAAAPGAVITMSDTSLTTTGALAADPGRGVYWTANSQEASGTGAVHAVGATGQAVGQVTFAANPVAVEGLAVLSGQVYVGDIGDPSLTRQSITVYRLEQISLGAQASYSQWTLHYPDGPHDAQTLMVSPRGNVYVITKGNPGIVYYVVAPPSGRADLTLNRLGNAPAWVTDGTFLDAQTAVVRTYTGVLVMNMLDFTVTASAAAPAQPSGESVTTALDGSGLVLGSKGDLNLAEVAVPQSLTPLPAAPSAPPGPAAQPSSPVATPSGAATPAASPPAAQTPASASSAYTRPLVSVKTLIALACAVVVSAGAGVLAYRGGRNGAAGRR